MIGLYRLDDEGEPEPVADTLEWAMWMEQGERVVLQTRVGRHCCVSTVFLGLDYNHFGGGDPILWETMIFGGACDREIWRHRSKLAAVRGHLVSVGLAELAAFAPRRLKKAIRKNVARQELGLRERRRVVRAIERLHRLHLEAHV